jgi:hypothetical protein
MAPRTFGYSLGATGLIGVAAWMALRSAAAQAPAVAAPLPPPTQVPAGVASERTEAPAQSAPPFRPVPDLTQTDPDLGLPGGGTAFCGPVAVSDWLAYLGQHGYPRLLPAGDSPRAQQLELARSLARSMGTSRTSGTSTPGLLTALDRSVAAAGYRIRRLEYQGWRGHPLRYTTYQQRPQLGWIAQALHEGGAAFIHVGWYATSKYDRALRRHGGHWLAVVDVGQNEGGAPDPNVLVLRDPAPYAGSEPAFEFARAELMSEGWLIDQAAALPATGYYRLGGGMRIKREGEVAVVDGAVVLVLEP